jgi:ribosomal protein L29
MAHTYDELKHKTVAELREIAAGLDHEAVQGYTQLNKEHLLVALCKALGIDTHAHHDVKGVNKAELKKQLRELKKQRDEAIAAHDSARLKAIRRERHQVNHKIRRAVV